MNSETQVIEAPSSSSLIVQKGDELEVTAHNSTEMGKAQDALIKWCDHKIAALKVEFEELNEAYHQAHKNKWKSGTLKKHALLADKRVTFYGKFKAALEAGFVVVPNFPVEMFAIRTEKGHPTRYVAPNHWNTTHRQRPDGLGIGEGEYKNPFPVVRGCEARRDAQGKEIERAYWWADDWKELEFPLSMAKPTIMEATTRAMALKIFDDFAILPESSRNKDPMIIARIRDPRSTKYKERVISFIVAWHLNTRVL